MRSKTKKTRAHPLQAPAPAGVPRRPHPVTATAGVPRRREGFDPSGRGRPGHGSAEFVPPRRPASRRALKNWRVRSRLVLLIAIPTLTAIVLGGIRIGSSAQSAVADQRVEKLAQLSAQVTGLAEALQNERNDIVQFIVLGSGSSP